MRVPRFPVSLLMLLALVVKAQTEHKTEAQLDEFNGPVHSVATQAVMTPIKWAQPDGPSLVMPISCRDCEYDSEGNRIRSGEKQPDGMFSGENIEMVRDGQGHVIQRNRINATDGKVLEQEKDGPFGSVEEIYFNGPIARSTKIYDRLGNVSEWLSFDASGKQVSRSTVRTNPDGQWTEHATWERTRNCNIAKPTIRRQTSSASRATAIPAQCALLSLSRTIGCRPSGKLQTSPTSSATPSRLTSTMANSTISPATETGPAMSLTCTTPTLLTLPISSPTTAEWRDESGKLQYATWCEYEFDEQHN